MSHPDAEISDVCLRDYVNPIFRQKGWNARVTCGFQPLYFVKQMGNTGRPLWMAAVSVVGRVGMPAHFIIWIMHSAS